MASVGLVASRPGFMTVKTAFWIILLSTLSRLAFAQADAKALDKARFQSVIVNQWWSCENQANKDCDMRLLMIRADGFEFNCVNWENGFSGSKCGYALKVQDGFFELTMKECPNKLNSKFLYGYLSEGETLLLLVRQQPLALSPRLLSEKDWLKFEKVKR